MDLPRILLNNQYFHFVVSLLITMFIAYISYFILKRYIAGVVGRKKKYGETLLKQLSKPIVALIVVSGIYSALQLLSILQPYMFWIGATYYVVAALLIAFLISRIVNIGLGSWLERDRGLKTTPRLLSKVISVIIFVLAIIMVLTYFKIDITPLVAGLGVGAVVIGIALQSALANFFAGLHLISDRPIRVGDYVELEGGNIAGWIQDIGWRSTRIKSWQDTFVIIPNEKLASSTIINDSLPDNEMVFPVACGVAYESDLEKAEKVSLEVAKEIQQDQPEAVSDYEPLFRYREFGESNINFTVLLRAKEPILRYRLTTAFIKALKTRFDKEDIEISWPIMKVYRRQ